jgi:hypothetical protein
MMVVYTPPKKKRPHPAQEELAEIMRTSGPGTEAYKTPRVQRRVEELSRILAGNNQPIVGRGGRNA